MGEINQAILEALPDLNLVVRSDGVIVGNVGGRHLGIADEPGELIGTSLREVWTEDIAGHLNLLVRRSNDNPVFYVQYAHARLASLVRNAADLGVTPGSAYGLLEHPREGELVRTLGEFPAVVETAAELREPHRVARYLESLASAYHKFYDTCRVLPVGDEEVTELHRARLALSVAARQVLANGLAMLGVSAPERM